MKQGRTKLVAYQTVIHSFLCNYFLRIPRHCYFCNFFFLVRLMKRTTTIEKQDHNVVKSLKKPSKVLQHLLTISVLSTKDSFRKIKGKIKITTLNNHAQMYLEIT